MRQQCHHFLHSHFESETGFDHQRCHDQSEFSTFKTVSTNTQLTNHQQCHDMIFGIFLYELPGPGRTVSWCWGRKMRRVRADEDRDQWGWGDPRLVNCPSRRSSYLSLALCVDPKERRVHTAVFHPKGVERTRFPTTTIQRWVFQVMDTQQTNPENMSFGWVDFFVSFISQ